jgi:DNA-binding XRE family transcriptional regulator
MDRAHGFYPWCCRFESCLARVANYREIIEEINGLREKVSEMRRKEGASMDLYAMEIGIARSTYNKFESKRKEASVYTLLLIFEWLEKREANKPNYPLNRG